MKVINWCTENLWIIWIGSWAGYHDYDIYTSGFWWLIVPTIIFVVLRDILKEAL